MHHPPHQGYYHWILNMGNLTDGALRTALHDPGRAVAAAAAAARTPEERHRLLHMPFDNYCEFRRPCQETYHPGQSCVTAHARTWVCVCDSALCPHQAVPV